MPDNVSGPKPFATLKVNGQTQDLSSDAVELRTRLSDLRGLLRIVVEKKVRDIYQSEGARLDDPKVQTDLNARIDEIIKTGQIQADELNRKLAAQNLGPSSERYLIKFEIQINEGRKRWVYITPRDLAEVPAEQIATLKNPKETARDVVRDAWVDSKYDSMREQMPAELRGSLDGGILEKTIGQISDPQQRERYRLLVLDRLREQKDKALRTFYERRHVDYDQMAREGVLEARAAAQAQTQPEIAAMADSVLQDLLAQGIITDKDLKGEKDGALNIGQKLRLLFSLAEGSLGLRVGNDLDLFKTLQSIQGSLKGAERQRTLKLMHYALVDFPQRLLRESAVVARVDVAGESREVRAMQVTAKINETRDKERLVYVEGVRDCVVYVKMEEAWNQWVPNFFKRRGAEQAPPPFPKYSANEISASLKQSFPQYVDFLRRVYTDRLANGEASESFDDWFSKLQAEADRLALGSPAEIRQVIGRDYADALRSQLTPASSLYAGALRSALTPTLQEAWLRSRGFAAITDADVLAAMEKPEHRSRTFEETRDELFKEKFFGRQVKSPKDRQEVDSDYDRWLSTETDRVITQTLSPDLASQLKPEGVYGRLASDLKDSGVLPTGFQAYEFALIASDFLPLLQPETNTRTLSLDQTLEAFNKAVIAIPAEKRLNALRQLVQLRKVRDDLGRGIRAENLDHEPPKNPLSLYTQAQLIEVPMQDILYGLNPPAAQGGAEQTNAARELWTALRQRLTRMPHPALVGANLNLEDVPSEVTVWIDAKGELQTKIIHSKQNAVLKDLSAGKDDAAFWDDIGREATRETDPNRLAARATVQACAADLLRLTLDPSVPVDDFKNITLGLSIFQRNPRAQAYLQKQMATAVNLHILRCLSEDRLEAVKPVIERARKVLDLKDDKAISDALKAFYTEAGYGESRQRTLQEVASQYAVKRLWNDPKAGDLKTAALVNLPIPDDIAATLQSGHEKLSTSLQRYSDGRDWKRYRADIDQYLHDTRLLQGPSSPAEVIDTLRGVGRFLGIADPSDLFGSVGESVGLLRTLEGRLFFEALLRSGYSASENDTLNVARLQQLLTTPGTPAPVCVAIRGFLKDKAGSGEGMLNFAAPVLPYIDLQGKLAFRTGGNLRINNDRFLNSAIEFDGFFDAFGVSSQGRFITRYKEQRLDPGDVEPNHQAFGTNLDLLSQNFAQVYLREYWKSRYTYDGGDRLIARSPAGEMKSPSQIMEEVIKDSLIFPPKSKLAEEMKKQIGEAFSSSDKNAYGKRLTRFAEWYVARWNSEHGGDANNPAGVDLPPDFIATPAPRAGVWFQDFILAQQATRPDGLSEDEYRGLLRSLCDDSSLSPDRPEDKAQVAQVQKDLSAAIENLLHLPEGGWEAHDPSAMEIKVMAVLLRRLGIPITGLPEGKDTDRPFVRPEQYVSDYLRAEINVSLKSRLDVKTETRDWPKALLRAYRINSTFFDQAQLRADDVLGRVPTGPASRAVAVFKDATGQTQYRLTSDYKNPDVLYNQLSRAATALGTDMPFSIQGDEKYPALDAGRAGKLVNDFMAKDVNDRLQSVLDDLAKIEKRGLKSDFETRATATIDAFDFFWTQTTAKASESLKSRGRFVPASPAECLAAFLYEPDQKDLQATKAQTLTQIQSIADIADLIKADAQEGFLVSETRRSAGGLTADPERAAMLARDIETMAREAKGNCTAFFEKLETSPHARYAPVIMARLLAAVRLQSDQSIAPLTVKHLYDRLIQPDFDTAKGRTTRGVLYDLNGALDKDRQDLIEQFKTLRTQGIAGLAEFKTSLRAFQAKCFPDGKAGSWTTPDFAWKYLEATARFDDDGQRFKIMKDLFLSAKSGFRYARFNDAMVKTETGVQKARFYLAKENDVKLGDGKTVLPGQYIHFGFFKSPGAQRLLAQGVLSPSQINQSGDALTALEGQIDLFPDGISIGRLININKPSIDALPALGLMDAQAHELQRDLIHKNARTVAAVTMALWQTSPDGKRPQPEEIARAVRMINRMLTNKTMILVNHQDQRNFNSGDSKLEGAEVLEVVQSAGRFAVQSLSDENAPAEAKTEAMLAARLVQGLFLSGRSYEPNQGLLRDKDMHVGHAYGMVQMWAQTARQEIGSDSAGKGAEIVTKASKTLQIDALKNQRTLALRFTNQKSYEITSDVISLSTDEKTWKNKGRTLDAALDDAFNKFFLNENGLPADLQGIARLAQKDTAVRAALREAVMIFCRENLAAIGNGAPISFDAPVAGQMNLVSALGQQMSSCDDFIRLTAEVPHAFNGDYFFSLDRDLVSGLIEKSSKRYSAVRLDQLLEDGSPSYKTFSPADRARIAAIYFRHVAGNSALSFEEILARLTQPNDDLVLKLEPVDKGLLQRAIAESRSSGVWAQGLEGLDATLTQVQFIQSSFNPRVATTSGNLNTKTLLIPIAVQGRKAMPLANGTAVQEQTFPDIMINSINAYVPIVGQSFYANEPCDEIHLKSPIFSLKLFLYTNGQETTNPVSIVNGVAYGDNSRISASDLRAFAHILDDTHFFPDKTTADPNDINILNDLAKKMDDFDKLGRGDDININDIYLFRDDPRTIEQIAAERGIEIGSDRFQTLQQVYRAVYLLRNFHESLTSLLVTPGNSGRTEQRQWIDSLRELTQVDPRTRTAEMGRRGHELLQSGADVLWSLMSVTSLPEMHAANQVIDLRILQAKHILYRERLQDPAGLRVQDAAAYDSLRDTSIDADFLRRFVANEKYLARLENDGLLKGFINWSLKTDQQDPTIKRIIEKHGGAKQLILDVADKLDELQRRTTSGKHIAWKSLNINFSDLDEDTRVAKLVLQSALAADEITPSDAKNFSTVGKGVDKFHAVFSTANFLFATKTHYAQNLKAYLLQKGAVRLDQSVSIDDGIGDNDGLNLFDDWIDHAAIQASAKEFREFLNRYKTDPVKLVHTLNQQGFDFPGVYITSDPAVDAEKHVEYLAELCTALEEAADSKDSAYDFIKLADSGLSSDPKKKKVQMALRAFVAGAVPMWSMGQENQFNVGASIYACVGETPLASIDLRSNVKSGAFKPANDPFVFCRENSKAPPDAYWGTSMGERIVKRGVVHGLKEACREYLYFTLAMPVQIAVEMQTAFFYKLYAAMDAWIGGDPMAAHRLLNEAWMYLKNRMGFVAFHGNPFAWCWTDLKRMFAGEWDEKIEALVKFLAIDLRFGINSMRIVGNWSKSVGLRLAGREFVLLNGESHTRGVDWSLERESGARRDLAPAEPDAPEAERSRAARLRENARDILRTAGSEIRDWGVETGGQIVDTAKRSPRALWGEASQWGDDWRRVSVLDIPGRPLVWVMHPGDIFPVSRVVGSDLLNAPADMTATAWRETAGRGWAAAGNITNQAIGWTRDTAGLPPPKPTTNTGELKPLDIVGDMANNPTARQDFTFHRRARNNWANRAGSTLADWIYSATSRLNSQTAAIRRQALGEWAGSMHQLASYEQELLQKVNREQLRDWFEVDEVPEDGKFRLLRPKDACPRDIARIFNGYKQRIENATAKIIGKTRSQITPPPVEAPATPPPSPSPVGDATPAPETPPETAPAPEKPAPDAAPSASERQRMDFLQELSDELQNMLDEHRAGQIQEYIGQVQNTFEQEVAFLENELRRAPADSTDAVEIKAELEQARFKLQTIQGLAQLTPDSMMQRIADTGIRVSRFFTLGRARHPFEFNPMEVHCLNADLFKASLQLNWSELQKDPSFQRLRSNKPLWKKLRALTRSRRYAMQNPTKSKAMRPILQSPEVRQYLLETLSKTDGSALELLETHLETIGQHHAQQEAMAKKLYDLAASAEPNPSIELTFFNQRGAPGSAGNAGKHQLTIDEIVIRSALEDQQVGESMQQNPIKKNLQEAAKLRIATPEPMVESWIRKRGNFEGNRLAKSCGLENFEQLKAFLDVPNHPARPMILMAARRELAKGQAGRLEVNREARLERLMALDSNIESWLRDMPTAELDAFAKQLELVDGKALTGILDGADAVLRGELFEAARSEHSPVRQMAAADLHELESLIGPQNFHNRPLQTLLLSNRHAGVRRAYLAIARSKHGRIKADEWLDKLRNNPKEPFPPDMPTETKSIDPPSEAEARDFATAAEEAARRSTEGVPAEGLASRLSDAARAAGERAKGGLPMIIGIGILMAIEHAAKGNMDGIGQEAGLASVGLVAFTGIERVSDPLAAYITSKAQTPVEAAASRLKEVLSGTRPPAAATTAGTETAAASAAAGSSAEISSAALRFASKGLSMGGATAVVETGFKVAGRYSDLKGEHGAGIQADAVSDVALSVPFGFVDGVTFYLAFEGAGAALALIAVLPGGVVVVVGFIVAGAVVMLEHTLLEPVKEKLLEAMAKEFGYEKSLLKDYFNERDVKRWMSWTVSDETLDQLSRELIPQTLAGVKLGDADHGMPREKGQSQAERKSQIFHMGDAAYRDFFTRLGFDEIHVDHPDTILNSDVQVHLAMFAAQFRQNQMYKADVAFDAESALQTLEPLIGSPEDDNAAGEEFAEIDDLCAQWRDNSQAMNDAEKLGETLNQPLQRLDFVLRQMRSTRGFAFDDGDKRLSSQQMLEQIDQRLQTFIQNHPAYAAHAGLMRTQIWQHWQQQLTVAQSLLDVVAQQAPQTYGLDERTAWLKSETSLCRQRLVTMTPENTAALSQALQHSERLQGMLPETRQSVIDGSTAVIELAMVETALKNDTGDGASAALHRQALSLLERWQPYAESAGERELIERRKITHFLALNQPDDALKGCERLRELAIEMSKALEATIAQDPTHSSGAEVESMRKNINEMYQRSMTLTAQTLEQCAQTKELLLGPKTMTYRVRFDHITAPSTSGFKYASTISCHTSESTIPTYTDRYRGDIALMNDLARDLSYTVNIWNSCQGSDQKTIDRLRSDLLARTERLWARVPADAKRELDLRSQILQGLMTAPAAPTGETKPSASSETPASTGFSWNRPAATDKKTEGLADFLKNSERFEFQKPQEYTTAIQELVRQKLIAEQILSGDFDGTPGPQGSEFVERRYSPSDDAVEIRLTFSPQSWVTEDLARLPDGNPLKNEIATIASRLAVQNAGQARWHDVLHPDASVTHESTVADPAGRGEISTARYDVTNGITAISEDVTAASTGWKAELNRKKYFLDHPETITPEAVLAQGVVFEIHELQGVLDKVRPQERARIEDFLSRRTILNPDRLERVALRHSMTAAINRGVSSSKRALYDAQIAKMNREDRLITPGEWYEFLKSGASDKAAFERDTLQRSFKSIFGKASANVYGIRDEEGQLRSMLQQLANYFSDPDAVGQVDPANASTKAYNPDLLVIQIALHRLGLLDPREITARGNGATTLAWKRYKAMFSDAPKNADPLVNQRLSKTASTGDILRHMSRHIERPHVDGRAVAEEIKRCAEVWNFSDGATDEYGWQRAILGLTPHELDWVNRELQQITYPPKTLQGLLAEEMDDGDDRACVEHQYRGWYNPKYGPFMLGEPKTFQEVPFYENFQYTYLQPRNFGMPGFDAISGNLPSLSLSSNEAILISPLERRSNPFDYGNRSDVLIQAAQPAPVPVKKPLASR